MAGDDREVGEVRRDVVEMRDGPAVLELEAHAARSPRAEPGGPGVELDGLAEGPAEVVERVEAVVVREEGLGGRLELQAHETERREAALRLAEGLATAPGIDHGPATRERLREPPDQVGDVVIGQWRPAGARRGVPADDAGAHPGLPEVLDHLGLGADVRPELVVALHGVEVGPPRLVLGACGQVAVDVDGFRHGVRP